MMMATASQAVAEAEGELWTWGKNDIGQLGHGGTTNVSSPVQVGSREDWVQAAGAFKNMIGRTSDGKIWGWGENGDGQLGLGDTTDRSSPVQIGSDTDWSFIVGSRNYQAHALRTDGTLWAWGRNNWGQLGDGTTTNRSSPVQIGSETTWTWVSGGSDTLHAIREGKLFSSGRGIHGSLGHGNQTYLSSPTQVGAQTDWAQVHSSLLTTMAVKTTGKAYGWGLNYKGSLGFGNITPVYSPVQIGSLTNWYAEDHVGFMFGGSLMMTVKTDGTLWSCGRGNEGSQGHGDTTNRSSPVQVGGLTTWLRPAKITMGYSAMAIEEVGKCGWRNRHSKYTTQQGLDKT